MINFEISKLEGTNLPSQCKGVSRHTKAELHFSAVPSRRSLFRLSIFLLGGRF